MSYPVVIGMKFLLLLAVFNLSYVLVGKGVRKLLFSSTDSRGATDFVLGFLAAPMLIAVFCALTGQALWVGLVLLDVVALALLVYPRPPKSAVPPTEKPQPLILPLDVRFPHLVAFVAIAILVNSPYILGVLSIPSPGGCVDIEPWIFDFQPAAGVTTSLTAYGFPPRHHSAESVPLLYYTGYYVMPAAVAGLAPSLLLQAIVAQYVFGIIVYMLVLWQLVSHHFLKTSWRIAAIILCLSGSTLGLFCWKWAPYFAGTLLGPYIEWSYIHDTILQFLLWMPRHAIPAILALLILEAFAVGDRSPGFLRTLFFPVVFVFSSSLYVGLFLVPALLVGLVLIWRYQRGREHPCVRLFPLGLFIVLAGIALLPHYYTALIALTHGGAPTNRLGTAWFAPPVVGNVLLACGLGLVVGLPVCFFCGRRGLLWLVYLLTLLLAVFTSTFNSDIMAKGTATLMVLVAFLSSVALYRLWTVQQILAPSPRWLTLALIVFIVSYSLQSLAVGFESPASILPAVFSYRHRIRRSEFELLLWVRNNTKADQTVSLVQDDRTVFEPLFGRPACAAGFDALYDGQDIWADSFYLKQYFDEYSSLPRGIMGSDYVFLSREPMGFGELQVDNHFDEHRKMVLSLGLSIVKENEAGLIAMNPARTAEEKRASVAKLANMPPVSLTNGYHSLMAPAPDVVKWVQVDLGRAVALDEVRLIPARPTDFADTPGFGFPVRFRVEVADDPGFNAPRTVADQTKADCPNPGDQVYRISLKGVTARCVRVTATRLWNHNKDYWFALAELELESDGKNVARNTRVTALDSIEAGRWSCRYLVDGYDSRRLLSDHATLKAAR